MKTLRGLSGFGWDDQRKMVTAEPDVWDRYLKVCMLIYLSTLLCLFCQQGHPKARPFRKKSFPLYDEIAVIIGETGAVGDLAFSSENTQASLTLTQSSNGETLEDSSSESSSDNNEDVQDNGRESDKENNEPEVPTKEKVSCYPCVDCISD